MSPPLNLVPSPWAFFAPYGGLHVLTLFVCALLIAETSLLGRALRHNAESQNGEKVLRASLAALAVGYWLAYNIWWNRHGIDLIAGLPLQICDINGLIAPLALLCGWRWARATLYFWTAALTLQAFIQPMLTAGPASPVFWAFWTAHTLIAACAVYDIAVLGFRPGWGDLGRALFAGAIYVALVLPLDLWLGADYGYVGNPPPGMKIPPLVDALGPWPQRAVALVALAALGFVVALLPWRIVAARAKQAHGAKEPAA
jgi:hypothetical integral membrane protein (TIGR02206 family)